MANLITIDITSLFEGGTEECREVDRNTGQPVRRFFGPGIGDTFSRRQRDPALAQLSCQAGRVTHRQRNARFPTWASRCSALGHGAPAAGISILWQRQPGLQALAPDGRWRDVPMITNCLSVHPGTAMEVMTEGKAPATPYRVIDHGVSRQSIGFFLEPGPGAQRASLSDASESIAGTHGWNLQERFHRQKGYAHPVPEPRKAACTP